MVQGRGEGSGGGQEQGGAHCVVIGGHLTTNTTPPHQHNDHTQKHPHNNQKVLEEEEYQRRKEHYNSTGQRHYYFMNVGNGEVIDACRKGNQARFINHSCDPNCETQKWLVRGELAIGLFALTDVKAGEELTFDYNFERYGDKPMRCYCGTAKCRKFIGGTQESTADVEVRRRRRRRRARFFNVLCRARGGAVGALGQKEGSGLEQLTPMPTAASRRTNHHHYHHHHHSSIPT